jgi:hypothetical protein
MDLIQGMIMISTCLQHSFIHSCSCDLQQAPQWAMRYGTGQNMYRINVIHVSIKVKSQYIIDINIIFKIKYHICKRMQ